MLQNIKNSIKPLILIILDGWGISQNKKGNAVALSKTPTMDMLAKSYPYTQLSAHGVSVGLPDKQDGNSEAGHSNIGAGRILTQDVIKVNKSIEEGTFLKNPAFKHAVKHAKKTKGIVHVMGLLSNGMSAHSSPGHLLSLLDFLRQEKISNVYLHLFTDGRDSPQHAALKLVQELESKFSNGEKIATIMGRFYGMDRKKKWDRTELAYDVMTCTTCESHIAKSATDAITESYNRNNTDEFMEPYVIVDDTQKPIAKITDDDTIIFFNLRSDRARQISKAFVQPDFETLNKGSFKRKKVVQNLLFVAMTDFGPDLGNIATAYPSVDLQNTLPIMLADKRQFYVAETEKYAHVTYFFNGGYDDPVAGEKRVMVDSPDVKSYDETPEMSSAQITEVLTKCINKQDFDFITVNYACPDMIGHTGNLKAGIQAVEAVDGYLGSVLQALEKNNMSALVTADHGNVEEMINLQTGEIDTEHSINPVPFSLFSSDYKNKKDVLRPVGGVLGDIAPTVLDLFHMQKPKEMSGNSLLTG